MTRQNTPSGIRVVSMLLYGYSFLLILFAIILYIFQHAPTKEDIIKTLSYDVILVAVSILSIITGVYLTRSKVWARMSAIFISVITFIYTLTIFIGSKPDGYGPVYWAYDYLVYSLITLFILAYLIFDKKVKAYFS